MAKKMTYFIHDFMASSDGKMLRLNSRFGNEGVGLFWKLIEQIYLNSGKIDLEIAKIISTQGKSSEAKTNSMINYMIEIGLLVKSEDGFLSSKRVDKDTVQVKKRQAINRSNINKRWEKVKNKDNEEVYNRNTNEDSMEYDRNTTVLQNDTNVIQNDTTVLQNEYDRKNLVYEYSSSYSIKKDILLPSKEGEEYIQRKNPFHPSSEPIIENKNLPNGWLFEQAKIYAPSLKPSKPFTGTRAIWEQNLFNQFSQAELIEGLKKAEASDFLTGKISDNGTGFHASVAWLLEKDHFAKVLEGNYDNRPVVATKQPQGFGRMPGQSGERMEFVSEVEEAQVD